mmetsp:Transcript_9238/g.15854  ORF Transcript_9238/g.15854 Transcript_9238/m.15854 type:complete len:230 (-) Transcript_9238:103-792(-)|eukprot:CAMPEP_0196663656 /NCGR_PEP_ID=MMETSP1086-20130531/53683_1 /TAXON_ID=77921 /ORGANISM="Cyanoptyche  gloeocystis , Strain SAG4.97" /LENGTH=229 /DNA_ID=CAMNT_0041999555 /DNA_START=67 /DNA_END=756 /DNA_ORIENTATION=+
MAFLVCAFPLHHQRTTGTPSSLTSSEQSLSKFIAWRSKRMPVKFSWRVGSIFGARSVLSKGYDFRVSRPQRIVSFSIRNEKPEDEIDWFALPPAEQETPKSFNNPAHKPFVGSKKLKLMFTCKICDERIVKTVNRVSIEQGIVIVLCDGCGIKHLICDNFGWYGEKRSMEEIAASGGQTVTRMGADRFALEEAMLKGATAAQTADGGLHPDFVVEGSQNRPSMEEGEGQ